MVSFYHINCNFWNPYKAKLWLTSHKKKAQHSTKGIQHQQICNCKSGVSRSKAVSLSRLLWGWCFLKQFIFKPVQVNLAVSSEKQDP